MRIILVFLLMTMATVLPGCWDLTEMNELALVTAIGIDRNSGEGTLRLTVEVSLPRGGETSGEGGSTGDLKTMKRRNIIYNSSGKTLLAGINRLQQVMDQKLFLGYVGTIIIGEEAAKKDMVEILSFLDRSTNVRRSSYLLVTPGIASDVLSTIVPRNISVNEAIRSSLKLTKQTEVSFGTKTSSNIFQPLAIAGIEPVVARIITTRSPTTSTSPQGQNERSTAGIMPGDTGSQGTVEQKSGEVRVSGMAVFRGTELAGWFSEKESRGWNWVSGHIARGYTVALTPRAAKGELDPVTFRCLGGKSSIKFNLINGNVTAYVNIKVRGEVEQGASTMDLIEPDIIRSLEADLADEIKSEVEAALEKSQRELKSDVFGFGFQLFRKHRREWNREFKNAWPEIYPSIPINVSVEASIQNTGTIIRGLELNP